MMVRDRDNGQGYGLWIMVIMMVRDRDNGQG